MPVVEIYFKVGASAYVNTDTGEIEDYYIDDDDEAFEEDWYYLEDGTRPGPEICARALAIAKDPDLEWPPFSLDPGLCWGHQPGTPTPTAASDDSEDDDPE